MANRVWVLGAQDPEMELIDRLLRQCGETIVYATDSSGQRVHPGNAYRCPTPSVPKDSIVFAVECIDSLPEGWVRIDHHRPGDPGYGRPPNEFLPASSIGQVIKELARLGLLRALWTRDEGSLERPRLLPGELRYCSVRTPGSLGSSDHNAYLPSDWREVWMVGAGYWSNGIRGGDTALYVPHDFILCAAADHCLAAAYRGECPGVDPDELLYWRVKTRAAYQGRSEKELLADVYEAQDLLENAPNERLAHGIYVADMRGYNVPELVEAAMVEGMAYITLVADRDGRRKIVLGGNTTPEIVQAFMTEWAPKQGLVDIYGDPARGFAGGYLPDP